MKKNNKIHLRSMDERMSLFTESASLNVVETAEENWSRSFSLFSLAPLYGEEEEDQFQLKDLQGRVM